MAICKAAVTLHGINEILLHNGQTADPRNKFAKDLKAVSGKRKKTDADHDQMAKIEWTAGLYIGTINGRTTTTVPAHVLESVMIAGAKKSKRGPSCKSGVFIDQDADLDFRGKPSGDMTSQEFEDALHKLYKDGFHHLTTGVKVGTSRVMRTRPKFSNWSARFDLEYDDEVLTLGDLKDIAADAGRLVGVGDWRPKFGRFLAEVEAL